MKITKSNINGLIKTALGIDWEPDITDDALRILNKCDSSTEQIYLLGAAYYIEQTRDNLYFVYQRVCGVTVIRMEERVYARVADKRLSKALGIKVDHPVLVVERLAFSFNDTPVEIRRRAFEGLEYHYLFIQNRFD